MKSLSNALGPAFLLAFLVALAGPRAGRADPGTEAAVRLRAGSADSGAALLLGLLDLFSKAARTPSPPAAPATRSEPELAPFCGVTEDGSGYTGWVEVTPRSSSAAP